MIFNPRKIIWHHTADSYNGKQFLKVDRWHKTQNYPLSKYGHYCGYHVFLERDGEEIIARSLNEIGAHTLGLNEQSFGIGMAGNFDIEQPTPAQKAKLGKWCNILMKKAGIPITEIHPHRHFANKSCPGKNLPDKFAQFAAIEDEISIIKKTILYLQTKGIF